MPDQQIGPPTDDRGQNSLRLSARRALLGAVGPSVRAVSVGARDKVILFRALVDPDVTDEEREDLEVAATEVIADYPAGWTLDVSIDEADADALPQALELVYLRGPVR